MSQMTKNVPLILLGGLLALVLLGTGVVIGKGLTANQGVNGQLLKLHASASSTGKSISLATGLVDSQTEGLFILDHLNGNLQCWLINSRTNELGGIYRGNVLSALGGGKEGADADLVLTTGNFEFNGRGAAKPARCIAYVADGNSGRAAAFGFTFSKANIQRGNVEEGSLQVICSYPIRNLQVRDQ